MFDVYGRPLQPPQYQYPPQQQAQNPYLQDLTQRMREMEARIYGQPQLSQQPQSQVQPVQPQPQAITMMQVKSESEAWNYPNDIVSGQKQFFIDMDTMTVYAKWVDGNIDLQRAVGKLLMLTDGESVGELEDSPHVDIVEMIHGVDEKITDIVDEIAELRKLIVKPRAESVEIEHAPKKAGRPRKGVE